MKRRNFIKKLPALGALPYMLNGIPFGAMAATSPLQKLAALSQTDRVLIILQLHGGNDGLNMVIPIANYDKYYNVRANIAIPEKGARGFIKLDGTLPNADQVGLDPDMIGVKELYDRGDLAIVQGVSYDKNNGSHFRGRDILFMGGGADDYLDSGWVGRYLKDNYAPSIYPDDFPNPQMEDPLALEFGNEVSLIFHQSDNIPTSISINNPESFFDLVNTLPGYEEEKQNLTDSRGFPPAILQDSPYWKELNYILSLEDKTDDYAQTLVDKYRAGVQQAKGITYPTTYPFQAPSGVRRNPLSGQLQIIANLLSGGCKTKVFLVRIGGFDNHADQVEKYDPTYIKNTMMEDQKYDTKE